jgi:phenylalanyl-tRNA synthetase alpha chain
MNNVSLQFETIKNQAQERINQAQNLNDLEIIRVDFLGRKGKLADLMVVLKDLSLEEKRVLGPIANTVKTDLENLFNSKKTTLFNKVLRDEEERFAGFDVTAYKPGHKKGSLHPLTQLTQKNIAIFTSLGFSISDGPEVETEFYNFEALNIPASHPARDMQDTFWIDVPGMLLRTQTSTVQIHTMQQQQPPIAIVTPGRVYRQEATDASHDFMFNQLEGLVIDENISMSDLLGTLKTWLHLLFNRSDLSLRIRPGYFPFVEPGIEVDVTCPFCKDGCSTCKKTGWIEMGGAGLVHPNVLKAGGIDATRYRGFAFGFGTTRLAMLMYGINDIRHLHNGDREFLKQF